MKKMILVCLVGLNALCYGQSDSSKVVADTIMQAGKLTVHKSKELDIVVNLQKKINKENCPELVEGYRVQIFSCSGADCFDKANKYYNQFLIAYPDLTAHKMRQPPSIKVRIGDCRTRFEAEEIKNKIKHDFPAAFIVPDYIESPYAIDCDDMQVSDSTVVR